MFDKHCSLVDIIDAIRRFIPSKKSITSIALIYLFREELTSYKAFVGSYAAGFLGVQTSTYDIYLIYPDTRFYPTSLEKEILCVRESLKNNFPCAYEAAYKKLLADQYLEKQLAVMEWRRRGNEYLIHSYTEDEFFTFSDTISSSKGSECQKVLKRIDNLLAQSYNFLKNFIKNPTKYVTSTLFPTKLQLKELQKRIQLYTTEANTLLPIVSNCLHSSQHKNYYALAICLKRLLSIAKQLKVTNVAVPIYILVKYLENKENVFICIACSKIEKRTCNATRLTVRKSEISFLVGEIAAALERGEIQSMFPKINSLGVKSLAKLIEKVEKERIMEVYAWLTAGYGR